MEFGILGVLEVVDAGRPVHIGASKERALLAALVLHANQIVSRERLNEVVWGQSPPVTATATLNTYISHLRAALEPGRAPRRASRLLLTRNPGYLLAVDPELVDAPRFERLAAEGRLALSAGDADAAALTLREALALWRGEALADFAYEPFARADATRLNELRLATTEERVEADLALGRHHDLVPEVRRILHEQPLRERLWGQLILALYRCGRQSEALQTYGELRSVLLEELGIDPSPALRQLEDDVLHQRPELQGPAASTRVTAASRAPSPTGTERIPPTNLPTSLTSFIGHEQDLCELEQLCAEAQLVTFVGAGGVGKTRLAIEVASRALHKHPDGVFLVELAPLTDPRALHQRVLRALGVAETHSGEAEALLAAVAERKILLVMDNCEHLVDACALLIEDLLVASPNVRILATSRELLRIPAERVWPVPSLSTPGPNTISDELVEFEAVRLFLDRARAVCPGWQLSAAAAAHVADICIRLEGIPLAIELAAARVRLLSVADLAERLDDRFGLLSNGPRSGPSRHRTLRAAVDWSYDSLTVPERHLFQRLSVFSGGFALQAAEVVCPGDDGAPATTLDTLTGLVDKSMVVAEPGSGVSRFRLLETLRQYSAERLAECGKAEETARRHLAWARHVAAQAEPHMTGGDQAQWLEHLAVEHDNLRAALECAMRSGYATDLLSLASDLGHFWEVRGHLGEGRRWLETALDTGAGSAAVRAQAHRWAGVLAQRQGDHQTARRHYEEGLALSRQAEDRRGTASALHSLGNLEGLEGRLDAAAFLYEESLAIGREVDEQRVTAASLTNLAWIAQSRGDLVRARRFLEEALPTWQQVGDQQGLAQALTAVAYLALLGRDHATVTSSCRKSLELQRALGDRYGECWSLTYLGWAAQNEGDLLTARQLHNEALAVRRELGDRYGQAWSLSHLGDLERAAGHPSEALRLLDESLEIAREQEDTYCIAWSLLRLAKLARSERDAPGASSLFRSGLEVARGRGDALAAAECLEGLAATLDRCGPGLERSARLLGRAQALREAVGGPVTAADLPAYESDVQGLREALGEEAFLAAWLAGRDADLESILTQACEVEAVGPVQEPDI